MGKILERAQSPPLYNRETELYPAGLLPREPIASKEAQEKVNWNWAFARTINGLRNNRMTKDEAVDIMFKAHTLLMLSYAQVYGRKPVLPEINARGR